LEGGGYEVKTMLILAIPFGAIDDALRVMGMLFKERYSLM
jgi:hypothetical protein